MGSYVLGSGSPDEVGGGRYSRLRVSGVSVAAGHDRGVGAAAADLDETRFVTPAGEKGEK